MADWATISALATAGGTLALAGATYASVRSANRSARVAEVALQEQRRPVLVESREDDLAQTVGFVDGHSLNVHGGAAAVEVTGDTVYLALSLRNVGSGIAVLQAWRPHTVSETTGPPEEPWRQRVMVSAAGEAPVMEEFLPLTRDQYVASGGVGIWQGALRDAGDPLLATIASATVERRRFLLDLLYTDQVGEQRTISRFGLWPEDAGWRLAAARHWYLDSPAPR